MNSEIKKSVVEFSKVCAPSDAPWEQIRVHVDALKPRRKTNWISRHTKLSRTIVGTAVIVSGIFGGAILSPSFAVALDKTPGVNQVYDWFGDPGLNHVAVFDNKMHVSSVDKGITFTVTDAYYDQGRLALQYQVSLPDRMIGVPAVAPDMDFYINGNKVTISGMGGGCGATTDTTWQGMYEIMSTSGLPKEFKLQIAIHKIGNVRGYWQIQVPVSGSNTFEHSKTFTSIVGRSANGTAITLQDVTLTPATVMVDYKYTGNERLHLILSTADGVVLRPISSQVIAHHTNGSTEITDVVDVFSAPSGATPKSINVTPATVLTNQKLPDLSIQVPLN